MGQDQTKNVTLNEEGSILSKIAVIFSEERLKAYASNQKSTLIVDALATKAWNMALCGNLYPILQIVEICLRNSIHNAMRRHTNRQDWFCDPQIIGPREFKIYLNTVKNLEQLNRKSDANHVLSELNFGFWTNLLNREYERKIWHPLIKDIFPFIPKNIRRRQIIFQRFKEIRKLRNRVFHHQRIWHLHNLQQQKTSMIEAILWIEPAVISFIEKIDIFDQIYQQGASFYKQKLSELMNSTLLDTPIYLGQNALEKIS